MKQWDPLLCKGFCLAFSNSHRILKPPTSAYRCWTHVNLITVSDAVGPATGGEQSTISACTWPEGRSIVSSALVSSSVNLIFTQQLHPKEVRCYGLAHQTDSMQNSFMMMNHSTVFGNKN